MAYSKMDFSCYGNLYPEAFEHFNCENSAINELLHLEQPLQTQPSLFHSAQDNSLNQNPVVSMLTPPRSPQNLLSETSSHVMPLPLFNFVHKTLEMYHELPKSKTYHEILHDIYYDDAEYKRFGVFKQPLLEGLKQEQLLQGLKQEPSEDPLYEPMSFESLPDPTLFPSSILPLPSSSFLSSPSSSFLSSPSTSESIAASELFEDSLLIGTDGMWGGSLSPCSLKDQPIAQPSPPMVMVDTSKIQNYGLNEEDTHLPTNSPFSPDVNDVDQEISDGEKSFSREHFQQIEHNYSKMAHHTPIYSSSDEEIEVDGPFKHTDSNDYVNLPKEHLDSESLSIKKKLQKALTDKMNKSLEPKRKVGRPSKKSIAGASQIFNSIVADQNLKPQTIGKPEAYTERMRQLHSSPIKKKKDSVVKPSRRKRAVGDSREGQDKRCEHNQLERMRRVHMKANFEFLVSKVPELVAMSKPSKVVILETSTKFIKNIREAVHTVEFLKRKHARLTEEANWLLKNARLLNTNY